MAVKVQEQLESVAILALQLQTQLFQSHYLRVGHFVVTVEAAIEIDSQEI